MTRVLVVEDHADIRRLIRMSLELEAYEVAEASNGVVGMELVREQAPDVLLLDVMMPGGVDGLELCRQVRADPRLQHTRILMLSACGTAVDRQRGRDAGADGDLVKPFSPLQRVQRIAELTDSRRGDPARA